MTDCVATTVVCFIPDRVWNLLVQLHLAQRETVQQGREGPFGATLDGLWQEHASPLVAYGLHAVPVPDWQLVGSLSKSLCFFCMCILLLFRTREVKS